MIDKTDDTICPFCGKQNQCMAHVKAACWCNEIHVPQKLIDIVPENKGKACICRSCILLFKENPVKFKNRFAIQIP